jgi:methionine-rich copper-binding protein CopC
MSDSSESVWPEVEFSHQTIAVAETLGSAACAVIIKENAAQKEERMEPSKRYRVARLIAVLLLGLLIGGGLAESHAILKESRPAANSQVAGPDVPIILKYNVRIDAKLSKLQLLNPDNSTTNLKIEAPTSPDTLNATATGLKPGAYRIRWQVLAPDGHITRGEIPFTVTAH